MCRIKITITFYNNHTQKSLQKTIFIEIKRKILYHYSMENTMRALIWHKDGNIEFTEKQIPKIQHPRDAIVKVTMSSICTSDLHIIHNAVPQAIPETILGHEFVGEIIETGSEIKNLKIGDRVSANCETFCGECFFCRRGYINNCTQGGWKLGCTIDGCQTEYVLIPFADTGLTKIPENVSYENALFVGDILSSGYFGALMCEIKPDDTIAVIGSGPVGLCAMQCAKLLGAGKIIAIDIDESRLKIAKQNKLADIIINPEKQNCEKIIKEYTENRGADGVIEAAGTDSSFQLAWQIARPNAVVGIVAMYENSQNLPLPSMYGKNLTFKTGGVDAVHCKELLQFISEGKLNTDFLISEKISLNNIIDAYNKFAQKQDGMLKIAITPYLNKE